MAGEQQTITADSYTVYYLTLNSKAGNFFVIIY